MSLSERIKEQRKRLKKNVFFTLGATIGYVIIYLAGRIFGTTGQQTSVIEWLFGDDPMQLSYLYGWLLHQNIFWIAMAVSVIPALFGKKYFSFTTLAGFALGLLIGELGGTEPGRSSIRSLSLRLGYLGRYLLILHCDGDYPRKKHQKQT